MRLNYSKLGEYIELVSDRNTDIKFGESDVRGVSNYKEIIPTKANNKSRDFSNFYVVDPSEFIYNSRTSRMGEKVGLGYNNTENTIITSFNNTAFRIKNERLLPMYLFMWFKRPEFDRFARFHSWGSSTELFSWDDMCNVELPVLSIDKQREIVKEYNTIVNRINLNEKLNEKLEETTQALYKHWFIDSESNNGRLLGSIFTPKKGKNITRAQANDGNFPVIAGGKGPSCYHYSSNTTSPVVTISASGANAGFVMIHQDPVWASDCSYVDSNVFDYVHFVYCCLKVNEKLLMSKQTGTGQPHIYPEQIVTISVHNYTNEKANQFNEMVSPLYKRIGYNKKQNLILSKISSLLLSKMTRVESLKTEQVL